MEIFKDLLKSVYVVTINCMRMPQGILTQIEELMITPSKKMVVIVLDEIDVIDQETLYKLFEWVALPYSKLILIGIVITHTNLQAASNTLEGRAEQSAGQSKSEMLAASKTLWWLCTTNSTVLVFL